MHPGFHYDAKVFNKLRLLDRELNLIDLVYNALVLLPSGQDNFFQVIEPLLPRVLSGLQLMPPQGELQREASQPLQSGHSGPFHCHGH